MKHSFCRALLKKVMANVRVDVSTEDIQSSWTHKTDEGRYEFHGPDRFYRHGIRADCLWSAKAEGWRVYLDFLKKNDDAKFKVLRKRCGGNTMALKALDEALDNANQTVIENGYKEASEYPDYWYVALNSICQTAQFQENKHVEDFFLSIGYEY